MPYRRGDVILVVWPNADRRTYKLRPALVVQSDTVRTGFPSQLAAQITSRGRTGPSRVPVQQQSDAGRQMSLQSDSVILTDQLMNVFDSDVRRVIGRCPVMDAVGEALRRVLDL